MVALSILTVTKRKTVLYGLNRNVLNFNGAYVL